MKRLLSLLVLIFSLPGAGLGQERVKFPVGVSSKVLGYGHLWAAWRRPQGSLANALPDRAGLLDSSVSGLLCQAR